MRKLIVLILVALGLLLVVPASSALASAKTFYVHPSGGNDTYAIQRAFNAAVKAGPGSTVQLSAGHFYTNNIVVQNFRGTFKGAGEHKTFIDCLRGLKPSEPGVTVLPEIAVWPFLVDFSGGHINVSDLSFDITATSPAATWDNGGTPSDYLMVTVFVTDHASSAFRRVSFSAAAGNDVYGFNTDEGLVIAGRAAPSYQTGGTDSICGCSFAGPQDGVQIEGLTRGRATITGNVFDDVNFCCLLDDSTASRITISDNQMSAAWWDNIVLWQGFETTVGGDNAPLPALPAPHYLISDNRLSGTNIAGGVWVEDDAFAPSQSGLPGAGTSHLDATIAHNTIILDNGGYDGGIDGMYAQRVVVLHNRISGTCLAGIDAGTPFDSVYPYPIGPANGWRIIGNDVSGVTASTAVGGPGAQIWLGEGASHCLVVGGCQPTTVLDQGTNDTLVNVTQLPLPATASASPMGQTKRVLMKGDLP